MSDLERQRDELRAQVELLEGELKAFEDGSGLSNVVEQLRAQHEAEEDGLRAQLSTQARETAALREAEVAAIQSAALRTVAQMVRDGWLIEHVRNYIADGLDERARAIAPAPAPTEEP